MWCYENGGGGVCCVCIKDLTLNMRLLLYETPFHIFVKGHKSIVRKKFWMEVDWDETMSDHMPLVAEIEF